MFTPPKLPWEVLERIIGHCSGDPQTLRHCSLTCRQLRPRSLCLLVSEIDLTKKSRDDVFALCHFLLAYPHLLLLVDTIATCPDVFAPFPLLHVLPNLSQLVFTRGSHNGRDQRLELNSLPLSILTCYQRFGANVATLHLSYLSFPTYQELGRLLLAFPAIKELHCDFVTIRRTNNTGAQLDHVKRRLSRLQELKALVVNVAEYSCMMWFPPDRRS